MKTIVTSIAFLGLLLAAQTSCMNTSGGSASSPEKEKEFLTYYELHDYNHTPRYKETVEYCKKLDEASDQVSFTSIGKSPEGRDIPLLILDKDGYTTPQQVRKSGKAVILAEACIHAGEPDGKEAGLMFIRDIAIHKKNTELLDNVTFLFIPILNVDGHEQFSAYNRINQNGPAELGTRTTKQRLNMNRDFVKADSPEMRHWLKLYNDWLPELFIDVHVTNGADFQYVITYSIENSGFTEPNLMKWSLENFENPMKERMAEAGYPIFPYFSFRNYRNAEQGVTTDVFPPQYSNGYATIRNRIGLLLENHIYKPYKQRVDATYRLFTEVFTLINNNHKELQEVIALADRNTASKEFRSKPFALNYRHTFTDSIPTTFLGWETAVIKSDLTGNERIIQDYSRPVSTPSWIYTSFEPTVSVQLPEAYIISAENLETIEVLDLHGIQYSRIKEEKELEVETYRFTAKSAWSRLPYEGRFTLTPDFTVQKEKITYPAGSVVVDMSQPRARLIPFILEPASPTSLVYWGFFNSYIRPSSEFWVSLKYMEVKGPEMMAADPALKAEFEKKMASDPAFASNPQAILQFFMSKIRKNVEPYANLYPIGRIMEPIGEI